MIPGIAFLFLLQASPQEVTATGTVGFGGNVVRGDRAEVRVEVDNSGPPSDLVLYLAWAPPGGGQEKPSTMASLRGRSGPTHRIPFSIASYARKILTATVVVPALDDASVWAFIADSTGKVLSVAEIGATFKERGAQLLAIVGREYPPGIDLPGLDVVRLPPPSLPEEWGGYSPLDALLWLDGDPSEFRTAAQARALKLWVSSGGRLIVARGRPAGLEESPLEPLLPMSTHAAELLPELLEDWRIPEPAVPPRGNMTILRGNLRRGRVLLQEGGIPLVIDAPRDVGRVTMLTFDPARPPFSKWTEARRFWSWLLDVPLTLPVLAEPDGSEPPPRLLGSLSLAQSAAKFPDVPPPAFRGLFILIGLYLVVVGPVDYLLLRALRKLEFTWLTFPMTAIGFSGLILLVGGAFVRRPARQREIAVDDHFAGSNFCRRQVVGAILSPADVNFGVRDADPLISNFLDRPSRRPRNLEPLISEVDLLADVTRVLVTHGVDRNARGWTLNRGATGILVADRAAYETPSLTYRLARVGDQGVRVHIRNEAAWGFDGGLLVTSQAGFLLPAIPKGETDLEGSRRFAMGTDLPLLPGNEPFQAGKEASLDHEIRQLLLRFSLSARSARAPWGFARTLGVEYWLDRGGTVLFAWRKSDAALVELNPPSSWCSSFVLSRFFQGADQ